MHRFELRVRYGDTDPMGWAYYATYLRWFEIGRAEMLRALGTSYREVEERVGVRLPVREAGCRYLRGARYDDLLAIETGVLERSAATVRFGYRVRRAADGELLATGFTDHFFMNPAGRPVRPPASVVELLKRAPQVPPDSPSVPSDDSRAPE